MSYIQKFFEQHLPLFYLEELRQRLPQPQFLLFSNQQNIFDLTLDLILSPQNCLQSLSQFHTVPELVLLCRISYQELQNVSLPTKQGDNEIVKILKTSLKYVDMQMLQILIRLVLCFYQSKVATAINHTLKKTIEEISLIYPALKIQISFSHPDINLCQFFDKYLTKITQFMPLNDVSRLVIQKIADQAQFIGPLEKLFKKYAQNHTKQTLQKDNKVTEGKHGVMLLGKEPIASNQVSNEQSKKSQRMSSVCSQKQQKFNEFQLFRNKKRKLIIKQRLKSTEGGYKTPYHQNQQSQINTPTISKKQQLMVRSDTTQNNASSILYRRLLYKKTCTIPQRTLYFGSTHKFVPKRSFNCNPQQYIESVTAASLTNQCSNPFQQIAKKTERKISKFMINQSEETQKFCILQTPKPKPLIRQRSSSTQLNLRMNPLKL